MGSTTDTLPQGNHEHGLFDQLKIDFLRADFDGDFPSHSNWAGVNPHLVISDHQASDVFFVKDFVSAVSV